jgi:hypothetical protein
VKRSRLGHPTYVPYVNALPGVHRPGEDPDYQKTRFFKKGNRYSANENLTEDAKARKFAGLIKTWKIKQKQAAAGKLYAVRVDKTRFANRYERKQFMKKASRGRLKIARQVRELQEMAQKLAEDGLKRMDKIINNPMSPDSVAVAATQLVWDRAYGKAVQTNANMNYDANGKPEEVSDAELSERIKAALQRIETIAGRAGKAPAGKKRPADLRKLDRDPHGPNDKLN